MYVDWDDGHAGGYPHDCPNTELCKDCGHTIRYTPVWFYNHTELRRTAHWRHLTYKATEKCPARNSPTPAYASPKTSETPAP